MAGEGMFEFFSLGRECELLAPPVRRVGPLIDKSVLDQLAEDPRQALLGDAQDFEEFGDADARADIHPLVPALR